MKLQHAIDIAASPEAVHDWLLRIDEHYLAWHPDHRACQWQCCRGQVGGLLYAEEVLHGRLHRLRFRITELTPRHMAFRVLGLPWLLVPRGDFAVEPTAQGCRFSASLTVRFGRLLRWLIPKQANALETHMREEGENLKRLMEAPATQREEAEPAQVPPVALPEAPLMAVR